MNSDVFSFQVGKINVTMLKETGGPGRPDIFIGSVGELINKYYPTGSYDSQINVFLIRTPEHTILVDTGFGGKILESMASLGVSPADVDVVLITHLHGDHFMGLQRDGKPVFPAASVFLAEQEKQFWIDNDTGDNKNGPAAALAPYKGRVKTFLPASLSAASLGTSNTVSSELFPGITPVAAFGHTPGHTAYLVQDGKAGLLITGDMVHAQDIQFPHPEIAVSYDSDPAGAVSSRREILSYAAANSIAIGGMHLVSPAIGFVEPENSAGEGGKSPDKTPPTGETRGYRYIPAK